MAEPSNTLIMGATPDDMFWADKEHILTDPTIYFLDRRDIRSQFDRYIQADVRNISLGHAAKNFPGKFQSIIVDVGTWHHFFEGVEPNIHALTYFLTPTGTLYIPQSMVFDSYTMKLNPEGISKEKVITEQLFDTLRTRRLAYSLVDFDTIKNINPALDLVASRMIEEAERLLEKKGEVFEVKFHIGTRVAAGGAKSSRSRKHKRKIRKVSRKLRHKY